ncbi:Hypothetical_protein [Hexamita inflata]|uniref:Hypothetical_protein n=1 Tax=Hexamita inflata TaxID=28002 RepID=A0AA86RBX7_9EUKA|nr:Hypothetical protein HINF_LOCUS57832 [Hexamita inflata]
MPISFASACHQQGDQLQVKFIPISTIEPTIFTKTVTLDEDQMGLVEFKCSEVIKDFPQCTQLVNELKGNSSASVVIQQLDGGNTESFLSIFVEIDTPKGLKGWEIAIIVCCCVGAVVIIVVIICTVLYIKKKNAAIKLPLIQNEGVSTKN